MAKSNDKPGQDLFRNIPAKERRLTVSESSDSPFIKQVPMIRLRGKWLAQAGFQPALSVRVRVMGGCIVITTD